MRFWIPFTLVVLALGSASFAASLGGLRLLGWILAALAAGGYVLALRTRGRL